MRFALGMDNREIARALGRTDGATKVLLHRAIRQLEELVKEAEDRGGVNQREPVVRHRGHACAQALAPVEPPEELAAAAGEHARHRSSSWPPTSSRRGSSRRCATRATGARRVRPAAAVVVGVGAGAGLVVLRTPQPAPQAPRRRPTARSTSPSARCATSAREALRVFEDAAPRR